MRSPVEVLIEACTLKRAVLVLETWKVSVCPDSSDGPALMLLAKPLTVWAPASLLTDWSGLADPHTTVVVYMGLAAAPAVRDGLIAAGRDPRTPVAVLARGTRPDAASVTGRLEALETLAAQVGEGPALIVVGDVVAHSDPWLAALAARAPQEIAA